MMSNQANCYESSPQSAFKFCATNSIHHYDDEGQDSHSLASFVLAARSQSAGNEVHEQHYSQPRQQQQQQRFAPPPGGDHPVGPQRGAGLEMSPTAAAAAASHPAREGDHYGTHSPSAQTPVVVSSTNHHSSAPHHHHHHHPSSNCRQRNSQQQQQHIIAASQGNAEASSDANNGGGGGGGSSSANNNHHQQQKYHFQYQDEMSRMRERLFRLLSKVPIHVETEPISGPSGGGGGGCQRPSKRAARVSDREPLIIKYYKDRTVGELLEQHFGCSLIKHNYEHGEPLMSQMELVFDSQKPAAAAGVAYQPQPQQQPATGAHHQAAATAFNHNSVPAAAHNADNLNHPINYHPGGQLQPQPALESPGAAASRWSSISGAAPAEAAAQVSWHHLYMDNAALAWRLDLSRANGNSQPQTRQQQQQQQQKRNSVQAAKVGKAEQQQQQQVKRQSLSAVKHHSRHRRPSSSAAAVQNRSGPRAGGPDGSTDGAIIYTNTNNSNNNNNNNSSSYSISDHKQQQQRLTVFEDADYHCHSSLVNSHPAPPETPSQQPHLHFDIGSTQMRPTDNRYQQQQQQLDVAALEASRHSIEPSPAATSYQQQQQQQQQMMMMANEQQQQLLEDCCDQPVSCRALVLSLAGGQAVAISDHCSAAAPNQSLHQNGGCPAGSDHWAPPPLVLNGSQQQHLVGGGGGSHMGHEPQESMHYNLVDPCYSHHHHHQQPSQPFAAAAHQNQSLVVDDIDQWGTCHNQQQQQQQLHLHSSNTLPIDSRSSSSGSNSVALTKLYMIDQQQPPPPPHAASETSAMNNYCIVDRPAAPLVYLPSPIDHNSSNNNNNNNNHIGQPEVLYCQLGGQQYGGPTMLALGPLNGGQSRANCLAPIASSGPASMEATNLSHSSSTGSIG